MLVSANQQLAEGQAGQQPRGRWSALAVLAIVIGASATALVVAGLCAWLAYFDHSAAPEAVAMTGRQASALSDRLFVDERWVQRVLSEVYTAAVDKVVTDQSVMEKLGEPVETDVAAEALFRRDRKGDFSTKGEAIAFDVIGPKGAALSAL